MVMPYPQDMVAPVREVSFLGRLLHGYRWRRLAARGEGFLTPCWVNDKKIINYSNRVKDGWQYHLFTDKTDKVETLGEKYFDDDGHCTFSADCRWMLTDSYPDPTDNCRALYLYNIEKDIAYELGRFYADSSYDGPARCDLHPSLSADGRIICFDSIHEGFRGIYNMDVSVLTRK